MKLFQYSVLWLPTEKQVKDDDAKPKILKDITSAVAASEDEVKMLAAIDIPAEYKNQLSQVVIAVRPF
jgi:hypothetical protein